MSMIRTTTFLGVWLALATSGLALLAQTQPPPQPPPQPPASPAIIAPPSSAPAQTAEQEQPPNAKDSVSVGPTYIIGPEDVLFIRVWKNPELSGSVIVGPDGTISLQLINEVRASGLTTHQLEQELATRLKKFIVEPEVNIQVQAARSRTYIILGDGVNRPGIYPLPRQLHVLEALIAGGGFSTFAKKNKIYVLRGTERIPFNYNEVIKGKNLKQNIYIQNGDQIYVP
jgi:polysaccharide biosynthesis/export protein